MASSKTSIYTALGANLLIAVTKFVAGGISNSSAMIAEGIHSMVDTVNQLLLLFGINQSKKLPDSKHPFGYGRELYFWCFIVSILIFGVGAGFSIYEGVSHMIHPEQLKNPTLNYVVLFLSILFEGTSLIIAVKSFNQTRGKETWWAAIVKSKDPSSFLVLFEDSAAVVGLLIVLVCTFLNHTFNLPFLDGLASTMVGLLLVGVSAIMARESRSLLMGESITPETNANLRVLVERNPHVQKVMHIISTYQSPDKVVLMMIVAFEDNLNTQTINAAIDEIRLQIKQQYKLVRFVIIQPESIYHHSYIE
jgi:cation diffusion facilitator family transporter